MLTVAGRRSSPADPGIALSILRGYLGCQDPFNVSQRASHPSKEVDLAYYTQTCARCAITKCKILLARVRGQAGSFGNDSGTSMLLACDADQY